MAEKVTDAQVEEALQDAMKAMKTWNRLENGFLGMVPPGMATEREMALRTALTMQASYANLLSTRIDQLNAEEAR